MDVQSAYQKAIAYATEAHVAKEQKVPGTNMPYVVHLSNVAMEILMAAPFSKDFDLVVAVQLALLHDTLEDTDITAGDLEAGFGTAVASRVSALTKNDLLPKSEKMMDSIRKIKASPKEVWAVKLADRITNMQEPPKHWITSKRMEYRDEAMVILRELSGGNPYLESRLEAKILEYSKYI